MRNSKATIAIVLITTIMLTGGVAPYGFANESEDDEEDICEPANEFAVMYEGPADAEVEIYKKTKHAKEGNKVLKDFPGQKFNSGDYIILDADVDLDQDKINPRTVYKIMHGSSWEIISFNTSCKKPIAQFDFKEKGDVKLTIMYGKDKNGDDVIFEKYRSEETNTVQECSDTEYLLDFESGLVHGSNQESIQAYLNGIAAGINNFDIEYSAQSNGPVNNPGAIYSSTNSGGADPDLEFPDPNPPDVGNMIIIQENNNGQTNGVWDNPDDEASGGKHTFVFKDSLGDPRDIEIRSWKNIDLEGGDENNVFKINGAGAETPLTSTGDDAWTIQSPTGLTDVHQIDYVLDGSGGIADICIQVPAPPVNTGTITVEKIVVAEDPSDPIHSFTFDLEPGAMTSPALGNGGTHTFTDLTPGMYTLTENFEPTDYTVEITCEMNDGAVINFPMVEGEVEITIEAGEDPVCIFTNTEKNPATLTIKKALTNDNNGDANVEDFKVSIWNVGPDELPDTGDDILFKMVNFDPDTSSFTEFPPAGTYYLTEEISNLDVASSYTTVLIAGDTTCPAMEGSPFTLSDNQEVTCTIYNDDNFNPNAPSGDGIIFHRNSINFTYNSINDDPPGVSVTHINGTVFNCAAGKTCISIDDPVMNSRLFTVQDPLINKASSLVIINIFALDVPGNEDAFAQKCVVGTLLTGNTPGTLDFTFECETHEGIVSDPGGSPPVSSLGQYRLNYAVIDTLVIVS